MRELFPEEVVLFTKVLEHIRKNPPKELRDRTPMTYDEILMSLRLAKRLGDCVPEDLEETARKIFLSQTRKSFHVVVHDAEGRVLDPSTKL